MCSPTFSILLGVTDTWKDTVFKVRHASAGKERSSPRKVEKPEGPPAVRLNKAGIKSLGNPLPARARELF